MKEEKIIKRWIKRKETFTVSLLVNFLMNGVLKDITQNLIKCVSSFVSFGSRKTLNFGLLLIALFIFSTQKSNAEGINYIVPVIEAESGAIVKVLKDSKGYYYQDSYSDNPDEKIYLSNTDNVFYAPINLDDGSVPDNVLNMELPRIGNVGGGRINSSSNDVVTGFQLNNLNERYKELLQVTSTHHSEYGSYGITKPKEITFLGNKNNNKVKVKEYTYSYNDNNIPIVESETEVDGYDRDNHLKRTLGETVSIIGNNGTEKKETIGTDIYTTKNTYTVTDKDNMYIMLKDNPEFKGLTLNDGKNPSTTLSSSPEGNLLVNGKPIASSVGGSGVEYFSVKSTEQGNKNNDGAKNTNSIAIGPNAKTQSINSTTVGKDAVVGEKSDSSVVVGADSKIQNSLNSGIFGNGNKIQEFTDPNGAKVNGAGNAYVVGGKNTIQNSSDTSIIGINNGIDHAQNSFLLGNNNQSHNAEKKGLNNSQVMGNENIVSNTKNSLILGNKNNESNSIGIFVMGTTNTTSASSKLNIIGTQNNGQGVGNSSILGNDNTSNSPNSNVVGNNNNLDKSSNVHTLGNDNKITSISNAVAIGNKIDLKSSNSFVLGSNITANISNSVFLGDKSTIKYSNYTNVPVKNLKEDATEGNTKTGGSAATITKGTMVGYNGKNIIYGGESNQADKIFAGSKAIGAVSVGYSGGERRIMNVAAGLIDPASTDAINGSQLYAVAKSGMNFETDTDAGLSEGKTTHRVIGDTLGIKAAKNQFSDGGPVFVGDNLMTTLQDNGVVIGFKEEPEFRAVTSPIIQTTKDINQGVKITNNGIDMNNTPITNLVAGTNQGDAVNKGQLDDAVTNINNAIAANKIKYFSVNANDNATKQTNINNDGATGENAIAIGTSTAKTWNSIALGENAEADANKTSNLTSTANKTSGSGAIAIGANSKALEMNTVVVGGDSQATGSNAVAIGAKNVASGAASIAMGYQAHANGNESIALGGLSEGDSSIAIGRTAHAGKLGVNNVSSIAMGNLAKSLDDGTVAIGKQAEANKQYAVALGSFSSAATSNSTAIGGVAKAKGETSVALGAWSTAEDANSVALGYKSIASGSKDGKAVFSDETVSKSAGVVSIGNDTIKRRITNVAGGIDDNDAVNVLQLKASKTEVTGTGAAIVTSKQAPDDKHTIYNVHVDKPVQFTKADGTPVTKVGDKFYTLTQDGKPDMNNEVAAGDVITSLVNSDGTSTKPTKLSNVAPAKLEDTSTEAVNGSQLKDLADKIGISPNKDGKFEAPTFNKLKNEKGEEVSPTTPATVVSTVNNVIDTVNKGLGFAGNAGDGTQQLGSKVSIVGSAKDNSSTYSSKNITTTYSKDNDGNGKVVIEMKENPTFAGDVTSKTGIKVENGPSMTKDGIDGANKKITNVGDGEISATSKDAVNGSQIHNLKNELTNNIAASKTEVTGTGAAIVTETKAQDGHSIYNVHVDKPVQFTKADGTPVTKVGDKFYTLTQDGKPDMNNEVAAGDVITSLVNPDGTSTTPTKLSNVAPAKLDDTSKEAVNGSQLKDLADKIGLTPKADGKFENPTFNNLKNEKGEEVSPTTPATVVSTVNNVIETVNKGLGFAGNTGDGTQQLGSKVSIVGSAKDNSSTYSSNNITTTYSKDNDGNGKVVIEMKENPTFAGDVTSKTGIKVENGPSMTTNGIDGAGKKITNVGDGEISATSKDAVNGSQLKKVQDQIQNINDFNNGLAGRVQDNTRAINELKNDHNNGMAQMAAMSAIDFAHVKTNKIKVGAGLGGYRDARAVAVGVAYSPTENLLINAKWSTPTHTTKGSTFGVGATYEFDYD